MFFLSGLFVPASLVRKGSWTFLSDRMLRIGLPFVLAVIVLMPLAYYPAYRVTAVDPGVGAYWQHWLALPFWPCGPQWFLWQLLALNMLAAALHRFAPGWRESLGRLAGSAATPSDLVFCRAGDGFRAGLCPAGFDQLAVDLGQLRPVLATAQPAAALSRVFLRRFRDRRLWPRSRTAGLRRPPGAALGCLACRCDRGLRALGSADVDDAGRRDGRAPGPANCRGPWLCCRLRGGCFFLLAVCLRFAAERTRTLDSLSANAYGMYLVHYVFVVWLQFALLDTALFAFGKAAIVFGGTLLMSWGIAPPSAAFHLALISLEPSVDARALAESLCAARLLMQNDGDRMKFDRRNSRWRNRSPGLIGMPLVFTLAFRNLFHDRLRLIATVIGIVFSIVLVTVQMGLYLGFGRMVTTMIDHASADLWIMPRGTKCFEDPSLLDARKRNRALSVDGVAEAIPVVIGFADWRTPSGSSTPVFVVGSDLRSGGLQPWNLVEGRIESLSTPNAVAVDRSYFDRLGISGMGARAEIRQQAVRVAAVTERHPLVHHHALRVHGRRSGAGPHRGAGEQGHLFSGSSELRMPTSSRSAVSSCRTLTTSRC